MAKKRSKHIDFDFWSQLAQDDPEGFECLRSETLESHILRASGARQSRLRCLQWRIDRIRDTSKTPMAACISISDLMWDTFQNLATGYTHLDHLRQDKKRPLPRARVLKFEPRP